MYSKMEPSELKPSSFILLFLCVFIFFFAQVRVITVIFVYKNRYYFLYYVKCDKIYLMNGKIIAKIVIK